MSAIVKFPNTPVTEHRLAYIRKRSPVYALVDQVVDALSIDPAAKASALLAYDSLISGWLTNRRPTASIVPLVIFVLEDLGVRSIRRERNGVSAIAPDGTSINILFPIAVDCSMSNS